ncbi:TA system VapC family ribonuclease toxin [Synoicihabitans lomoniglobus]|uniref:Ribonuclease VapC n=1 Tax=Synoicihabitans lomoniglobus TaxID=2909285 RepID=A0AAF0CPL0_9BACT|nr:PIN domain-containing protein [Opitutaceae bacterium LMO-M01]WED65299.1 PIN domain-containing protein [Opitutaceae bacterium LMO-M01]
MTTLLDVNVLIALVDGTHVHHTAAIDFFKATHANGWSTCPLTENGFLRILGRAGTDLGPDSPASARVLLRSLISTPGHVFWPDDVTLTDTNIFPVLPPSKDLTDVYLLALAVKHEGRFATFDQRFAPTVVKGGMNAYFTIPVR